MYCYLFPGTTSLWTVDDTFGYAYKLHNAKIPPIHYLDLVVGYNFLYDVILIAGSINQTLTLALHFFAKTWEQS